MIDRNDFFWGPGEVALAVAHWCAVCLDVQTLVTVTPDAGETSYAVLIPGLEWSAEQLDTMNGLAGQHGYRLRLSTSGVVLEDGPRTTPRGYADARMDGGPA